MQAEYRYLLVERGTAVWPYHETRCAQSLPCGDVMEVASEHLAGVYATYRNLYRLCSVKVFDSADEAAAHAASQAYEDELLGQLRDALAMVPEEVPDAD